MTSTLSPISFTNTALPDIIELKHIHQSYPNPKTNSPFIVIQDLNLLIEDTPNQNQFVVILGKSGCGKSTLLKYIAGLQSPSSGEILIHGKPRSKDSKVSMVFQKYSSFPWLTVIQNIELGLTLAHIPKTERRNRSLKILETVGLLDQAHKFPSELSGGQQQRVAIARSLLLNSNILLMDEPYGALDINTRLKMQDFLLNLVNTSLHDMTIVFVTHDIPEAVYLANEIWIMSSNPGTIVERLIIDLPKIKSKDIKRSKQFTDYVYYIEDKLNQL